jgi:predicted amidohydrolase
MADNRGELTRRHFMHATSAGLGIGAATASLSLGDIQPTAGPVRRGARLPREVWIASVSQNGLADATVEGMTRQVLARMAEVVPFEPDIVCLPEAFPFVNLSAGRPPLADSSEEPIGRFSRPFAEFAAKHKCHVVCPIYTVENGRYYNAAVFIDRNGQYIGQYRKMHPTTGEMEKGILPGSPQPPVFKTDIGVLGAQICFDIEWYDGWRKLREAGAELVFWPSAFAGGSMVNTHAWQNKYCVVSSTRKGTTRICDIDGQTVACTGQYANWVCAPVNLEKAFLHSWPFCNRFREIEAKYGRKVRIRTFHEEEWTIIESLDADVRIAEILKEFDLQTHEEHIRQADRVQRQWLDKLT